MNESTKVLSILLVSSIVLNIFFIAFLHKKHEETLNFKIGSYVTNGNCEGYISSISGDRANFVQFNCGLFYFSPASEYLYNLKLKEKPNNE